MQHIQWMGKGLLSLFFSLYFIYGFSQVTEQWVRRYDGPAHEDDAAQDLAVDHLGNVYVTGGSSGVVGISSRIATIKYDAQGNVLWIRTHSGSGNNSAGVGQMILDAQDNVFLAGSIVEGNFLDEDFLAIKYDTDGNELWVRTFDGPVHVSDRAYDLAVDISGNLYVSGYSGGSGTGQDYTTIKYDANGNELWVKRYNGLGNLDDVAQDLAVDGSGNVYVTGYSSGSGANSAYDITTIKYDADGNELWVKRYNGSGNGFDYGSFVEVDAQGNVYVGGSSDNKANNYDYTLIKYDAAGNELWVRIYDGSPLFPMSDQLSGLAVDAASNVYVTGQSQGSSNPTGSDFATIKYDPNGNALWIKRYSSGKESFLNFDFPAAIAVDAAGNVCVTGQSKDSVDVTAYTTVKYGPDGRQLWVKNYQASEGSNNQPNANAVDDSGNVYVTGQAGNDYTTIKYSQASTPANVNCGHKGDKVQVCHKGKTICISHSALAAHLKHGDEMGSCPALNNITENIMPAEFPKKTHKDFQVTVAPNPFTATTRLYYAVPADGRVYIKLYDATGRTVATVVQAERKAGMYSTELSSAGLTKGVYYYRAMFITNQKKTETQTGKVVVWP